MSEPDELDGPGPGDDPARDTSLRAVLDALLDHVTVARAVRSDDGTIEDFLITYMNDRSTDGAGRASEELVGRLVCDAYPDWRPSGMFDRFARVVETGEPLVVDRQRYVGTSPEGVEIDGWWSISVVPFGEDGYLAASRDMTAVIREEQARLAAQLDADRSRLSVEVLQRAAMPEDLPAIAGVDLAACHEPAASDQPVGGDWYDAFEVGGGRVGIVIADVAGHGPDAAAYMVQVRSTLRALAVEHVDPGRVLEITDEVLGRLGEQPLFATCCYGVLDPAERTFTWARAGHLEPLLVGDEPRYLEGPGGPPLGVSAESRFPEHRATLRSGEGVLLFTDGAVEERGRSLTDSLAELLSAAAAWLGAPSAEVVQAVAARVEGHEDDLAVLCARLRS